MEIDEDAVRPSFIRSFVHCLHAMQASMNAMPEQGFLFEYAVRTDARAIVAAVCHRGGGGPAQHARGLVGHHIRQRFDDACWTLAFVVAVVVAYSFTIRQPNKTDPVKQPQSMM